MQHIFLNNHQLCSEVGEPVLQHFVHLLATHGRHVQYLDFLHTVIKAEGKYVKKCQDMIMTEVRAGRGPRGTRVVAAERGLGGRTQNLGGQAQSQRATEGIPGCGGAAAEQNSEEGLKELKHAFPHLSFIVTDLKVPAWCRRPCVPGEVSRV